MDAARRKVRPTLTPAVPTGATGPPGGVPLTAPGAPGVPAELVTRTKELDTSPDDRDTMW